MATGEIDKGGPFTALLIEIGATKLILQALLQGALPTEKSERWAEIEAMVTLIEEAAKKQKVRGADPEASRQVVDAAQRIAVEFVRGLSPKFS